MTQHILEFLCKTLPDGSILLTAFHCNHISWSPPLFISPSSKNTSPLLQSHLPSSVHYSILSVINTYSRLHIRSFPYSGNSLLTFSVPLSYPLNFSIFHLPLHTLFFSSFSYSFHSSPLFIPSYILSLIPFYPFLCFIHSCRYSFSYSFISILNFVSLSLFIYFLSFHYTSYSSFQLSFRSFPHPFSSLSGAYSSQPF